jgi:hypothetical protein
MIHAGRVPNTREKTVKTTCCKHNLQVGNTLVLGREKFTVPPAKPQNQEKTRLKTRIIFF